MYRHIKTRRRSSVTNYKKRIALLKSGLPRIVIRKSNRRITMQVVSYKQNGDVVLASADSRELKGMGWPARANVPTAYLTGLLLASKCKAIKEKMVLDIGLYKPVKSSIIFAGAKGASDGGIQLLNSIEIDNKRVTGSHIAEYSKMKINNQNQFSLYRKENIDIANIAALFETVKKKIA